jgi:hypothetical protein
VEGGGICIPTPDPKVWGLKGADYEWVRRRLTPQPFALYQEPLAFDGARVATLPRTYIDCVAPALDTLAAIRRRVREEPGWRLVELAAGHDPMVSAPKELAQALLACCA